MKLNCDFVGPALLDRALELDAMAVDFCLSSQLRLELVSDVASGHRSESFARFACFELERDLEFVDAAREFFGIVEFLRFALCALGFEQVDSANKAGDSPMS